MNITLQNNLGFSWFKNEVTFFKGYFFDEKNIFYQGENALLLLGSIHSKETFLSILKKINGCFTIISKSKNQIFIASDTTRSFPLFYTYQNKEIHFSDDVKWLKEKHQINEFDALSEIELKASSHTHGKKTLLKNVFQVQSNEYLIVEKEIILESDFFYSYAVKNTNTASYKDLKKQAIKAFENSFDRLLKSLDNKTVVIPLSGGFDSRLIAVMLKNYKNVICYTYGNKKSFEIENSKKTAKKLGFKWHFIEYKHALINDYIETEEFKNYAHYAGKFSSMPNLQEYFAVKYLKDNKLVPDDAVFIPGYAGDLLGGSQFLKVIPESLKTEEIVDLIIEKKFFYYSFSRSTRKRLRLEIKENLLNIDKNYTEKIPSSVFEDYDIKEKIAKFIFNSSSFYTFFGYEYRFPFWDKELLDFFKNLPVKNKLLKLLFDDVLINNYFKPNNVYFKTEMQPSQKVLQLQSIKNLIKLFLPAFIKQKILLKNDLINYQPITNQMLVLLKKSGHKVKRTSKSYNEVITQWYVYFSKNKVK